MEQLWNRGGATAGKRSVLRKAENGLNYREAVATGCDWLQRHQPDQRQAKYYTGQAELDQGPIADALSRAWRTSPRIVVAGSIFLLGDVLKLVGRLRAAGASASPDRT